MDSTNSQYVQTTQTSSTPVEARSRYFFLKRSLDTIIASILLIILAPLLLIIAILIRLDSRGPALFKQKRVGAKRWIENGEENWQIEEFTMYKFRTMVDRADSKLHQEYLRAFIENDEAAMAALQGEETEVRKLVHDPRITRVGNWLRRTSLDELPQLWNVIRGEMSLVGPRPAIAYEVEMYKPWHYQRFATLPGVTGLWQTAARSSASFDEMIQLDIDYIERQSLWFDINIIVRTPIVLLTGKGAM
jgi:lipopolysaccharide/colanic/teichoic acid biosynthesis glycosyltransferase